MWHVFYFKDYFSYLFLLKYTWFSVLLIAVIYQSDSVVHIYTYSFFKYSFPLWFIIVTVQLLSHVQLFCDSMGDSPSRSSVHGISQARILEWVAISFFSIMVYHRIFFSWSVIALQCYVVLVSPVQQHESAVSLHVFLPSWTFLTLCTPCHPSTSPQSNELSSLGCTQVLTSYLFCTWQCVHVSPNLSVCPDFSVPFFVHKSILYACMSCLSLHIGLSVPFLQILYIFINI